MSLTTNWATTTVNAAAERLRKQYGAGWELIGVDAQHAIVWREVLDANALRRNDADENLELAAAVDAMFFA